MKGLKMTAKRILTGVLTAAMVVTSVNLPGMATSVQAATVYNDTATALSSLAGSTGLKIYRLTSADAGKELTSGIYYVDEDLTFTGADSTSSSEAGGNGLKIADGATVYLYIADGKTLTATGGKGYAGTDGANGTEASVSSKKYTTSGITYYYADCDKNGTGGAGGSGATGGGAAIYVPTGSKIAILGNGTLNATGGTGGNAGNGQNGQKTKYSYMNWCAPSNGSNAEYKSTTNNVGLPLNPTGTNTNGGVKYSRTGLIIGGAGGSGGGGASGGGAGIGTNGANGNDGATGVAGNYVLDSPYYVDKVSGNSVTATVSANSSGQIYIGNVTVNATGGAGGQAGSQQSVASKHQHSITYWGKETGTTAQSGTFWVQDGQSGGGGGAGGTGASIGTGGAGGQGGAGGDAGSCWTKAETVEKTGYAPESVRGANGSAGTNGTGSSSTLGDTQYPYNNITFTNLTSANRKYYLTKSGTFTAPDYSVSENQIFVGWKVTTPAVALPEAFGETADTQLTTADTIIPAGTAVSTAGIYGNITLEPYAVSHTHSWTYKTDSTDSSKVYAWCTADENSEYCPYHGEEKKLTLSLNAEGKTYDGNAYNGATVEDKITSVTKATAGSVTYYKADSDGNKTGSAISAPVNAGKYVAEVTLTYDGGSISAEDTFEITRREITSGMITLDSSDNSYTYTGSGITPSVTVRYTDGSILTKDSDYTIEGTPSATGYGEYTFVVKGAGNYAGNVEVKWHIKDDTNPVIKITTGGDTWDSFTANPDDNVHYYNSNKTLTISVSDTGSGVDEDKIYYYLSDTAMTEDDIKAKTAGWTKLANNGTVNINSGASVYVYTMAYDKSGNVSYASTDKIIVDADKPVVTGVESNKTYCEAVTVTITDVNLKSVYVNGTEISLTDNTYTLQPSDDVYNIEVSDYAGNVTVLTNIKINSNGHSWVDDEDKAATCTDDGYRGRKHCLVCGAVDEGEIIPATGHDYPDEWTVVKEAGATEEGRAVKLCKNGCGSKLTKIIEPTGTVPDPDTGSLEKSAEVKPNDVVDDAQLADSKKDLLPLFIDDEQNAIASGSDAKIWLEIAGTDESAISQTDKADVRIKAVNALGKTAALKDAVVTIKYFDASMYKQIDTNPATQLKELRDKSGNAVNVLVRLSLPESLINHIDGKERKYTVVRIHENADGTNEISQIDAVLNVDNELEFYTDKFSTYAVAYVDVDKKNVTPTPTPTPNPMPEPGNDPDDDDSSDDDGETIIAGNVGGQNNNNSNSGSTGGCVTSNPDGTSTVYAPMTGDNNRMGLLLSLMLAMMGIMLVVKVKEK